MKTFERARGMQVATLEEGAIVGKLDDFQFDLESGRIYGYRMRAQGLWGKSGGVAAVELPKVGRDLAFVTREAAVEWGDGARYDAEGRAWASAYRGRRVMSRRGEALGEVEDFVFDSDPPRVLGLLVDGGRLVPLAGEVALGRDAVIVPTTEGALSLGEERADTPEWWAKVAAALRPEAS